MTDWRRLLPATPVVLGREPSAPARRAEWRRPKLVPLPLAQAEAAARLLDNGEYRAFS